MEAASAAGQHQVFVSYSTHNTEAAQLAMTALEAAGVPCWIAPRNITPGVEWGAAIMEALRSSRLFLLIFSGASDGSPQVLREVERAVNLRLPVVTFMIEPAPLSPAMEYFLSVEHWLVATDAPLEKHLPALVTAVHRHLHSGPALETAPPVVEPSAPQSSLSAVAGPAVITVPVPLGNLPHAPTSLIGRAAEIAEIESLLSEARLVTLAGPPGCGKTRLALEAAAQRQQAEGAFPDGVWLVELENLTDADLLPQVVAEELLEGASGIGTADSLARRLQDKRLLLMLDNCEHVLAACAPLAERLLRICPGVRLLTTSREPLNIAAEQVYRVGSLGLPDRRRPVHASTVIESAAARLFVERARARSPQFTLSDTNAAAVAEICIRLDGNPLALELAAARAKVLSPEQIAARLDNRFHLLTGGNGRTTLPRQQTLRAAIGWSYDLLGEREQTLLRRLSVFTGGWTLDTAEAVCGDDEDAEGTARIGITEWEILDALTELVDKSLVSVDTAGGEESGTALEAPRYRMPESVRDYAREQLKDFADEESRMARAHQRYFLEFAEQKNQEIRSAGEKAASAVFALAAEQDNLRAAIDSLFRAGVDGWTDAAHLCIALDAFWERHGAWSEARAYLGRAIAVCPHENELLPRLLRLAGWFAYLAQDLDEAQTRQEAALRGYEARQDTAGILAVWNHLALIAQARGDAAAARAAYERCLEAVKATGDPEREAEILSNLGLLLAQEGETDRATACFEEALRLSEQGKRPFQTAGVLCNLSDLALKRQDFPAARRHSEESLRLFTLLGHRLGRVFAIINLVEAELAGVTEERPDGAIMALGHLRVALTICREAAEMDAHVPLLRELMVRALATLPDRAEDAYRAQLAAEMLQAERPIESSLRIALEEKLGPEESARIRQEMLTARPEEILSAAEKC